MSIQLNKVGVEIDSKVYNFYKLNFGFQRRLVELQTNLNKLQNEVAKKYNIDVSDIEMSEEVSTEEKLELARVGGSIQDALGALLVDPSEAGIIDLLDGSNLGELIEALK